MTSYLYISSHTCPQMETAEYKDGPDQLSEIFDILRADSNGMLYWSTVDFVCIVSDLKDVWCFISMVESSCLWLLSLVMLILELGGACWWPYWGTV